MNVVLLLLTVLGLVVLALGITPNEKNVRASLSQRTSALKEQVIGFSTDEDLQSSANLNRRFTNQRYQYPRYPQYTSSGYRHPQYNVNQANSHLANRPASLPAYRPVSRPMSRPVYYHPAIQPQYYYGSIGIWVVGTMEWMVEVGKILAEEILAEAILVAISEQQKSN